MIQFCTAEFPLLGSVVLAETHEGLCMVTLAPLEQARGYLERRYPGATVSETPSACDTAVTQLREYLEGRRTRFELSLAPAGTPFQQEVWRAVSSIAYGETRSYGAVASEVGRPTAGRAVGTAVGANPLCVVVPCHRVIGSDGRLTGYAHGLSCKQKLLGLEGAAGG